jgi:hypothetical protein
VRRDAGLRRGHRRRLQDGHPAGAPGKLTDAAAALYWRPPQLGEQDKIGAAIAAAMKDRVVEVWPENWPTFTLFYDQRTQWRVGFNGPTGLDHGVLYRDLDDLGITGDERLRVKAEISAMEQAALDAMHGTSS